MFDFVTKHKRLIQVMLALIAIPFAFFGLEAYTRAVGAREEAASVEGTRITRRELDEAMREQLDRLRQLFGRDFDVSAADTPELRQQVLEALIAERLVKLEVARHRMLLSADEVKEQILRTPEFQESGAFSPERYRAYLRAIGQSDAGYVETVRVQAPAARLVSTISASAIQPRQVAARLLELEGQRREVAEAAFPAERYLPRVSVDEPSLRAYYDANPAEFRVPERLRAEYLVLSAEDLARAEQVTEEELKAAYQGRAAQLGVAEQRRASHILLKTKEEAERIAAEARASPQRFAELAKKHSQDSGSAQKGGDLGLFGPGDMIKPFADAVFAMKPGEIAGPVQSEFGFHVIRLAEVQPGKMRSLEEARAELAAEIAKQKAAKRFAESADAFNNLVYEQSDSLKPAAARFKLKIQESGWIAKGVAAGGPLDHPRLLAALFSADAIQHRRNTDAVEIAPGTLVAARVAEHQPALQKKFEEVRAEVEERLRRREAAALARKEGAAKLAELKAGGEAGVKFGPLVLVSRRAPGGLAPEALRGVMSAEASRLPAYVGVERGARGYAIYRIQRVLSPDPVPEEQRGAELARLEREAGAAQADAYVASLRLAASVEINRAALEKKQ
jgi:peptidyl-prolyl cis-trans isomerase D